MPQPQADSHPHDAGLSMVGAVRLSPRQFGSLFEAHSRKLWCVAAAVLRDRARASDVVQEAAVIALGKLDEFDPATSFSAWMSQIVRYVALNEGRKNRRDLKALADPATMDVSSARDTAERRSSVGPGGQVEAMQHDFDDSVCAGLATLDETARACLLLKTVLDLPYAEIAESLGIPEGTAMSHVHRARRAMREFLTSPAPTKGGRA